MTIALIFLILQLVLVLVIFWYVGFLWETHQNGKEDRVLYHSSNVVEQGPFLKAIIQEYILDKGEQTNQYTLVEPGAGLARVSRYLEQSYKWKALESIELGTFIGFIARMRLWASRSTIKWIKEDIFHYSFPAKSVVYCYLFPALITKLHTTGKLKGKLVISLTFPIEEYEPTEKIMLPSWQAALYVYDFRDLK